MNPSVIIFWKVAPPFSASRARLDPWLRLGPAGLLLGDLGIEFVSRGPLRLKSPKEVLHFLGCDRTAAIGLRRRPLLGFAALPLRDIGCLFLDEAADLGLRGARDGYGEKRGNDEGGSTDDAHGTSRVDDEKGAPRSRWYGRSVIRPTLARQRPSDVSPVWDELSV